MKMNEVAKNSGYTLTEIKLRKDKGQTAPKMANARKTDATVEYK